MLDRILRVSVIFASAAVTIFLNYQHLPVSIYQQITAALLILIVIISSRFSNISSYSKNKARFVTLGIIFLSTFFIQILITSTGGLFSPFFILFHLSALTISFLVDDLSFVAFLFSFCFVSILDLKLNPSKLHLLQDDPGKALLLGASLLVIIPLAQFISKKYHLKEELSKMLSKEVKMNEGILQNLNDLVVITDIDLKITFVNDAIKRLLDLTDKEAKSKKLLDILHLKNEDGSDATNESLSIDKIVVDEAGRIVNNLLLYIDKKATPDKVSIKIKPIPNAEGKINQLSFVISESSALGGSKDEHFNLIKAEKSNRVRFEALKKQLSLTNLPILNIQAELLEKSQEELSLAKELDDHPISEDKKLNDIALIASGVVKEEQEFASKLKVPLSFSYSAGEVKESDFVVPIDAKWLKILITKIIDLSLLLSSGTKTPQISLTVTSISSFHINLVCTGNFPEIKVSDKDLLLTLYYGKLTEETNLKYGSGLEGYIIKSILTQLNLDFEIRLNPGLKDLAFIIHFSQNARK